MNNDETDGPEFVYDQSFSSKLQQHWTEPHEVDVPAKQETFEAQIVVLTKPYKRTEYSYMMSVVLPFEHIERVLNRGKYRVELVRSSLADGKPTVIIYEED